MTEVRAGRRPRRSRKPETAEQRDTRLRNLAVQLADREHRAAARLAAQTGQRPRARGHVTPLDAIEDEERRLAVQKARVERLEALLAQTERKRETRAKILLGATLLAEAQRGGDGPLLAAMIDILDRRLERPRDRLAVAEMLGLPITPLKRETSAPALPDFDAMAEQRLQVRPGVDPKPSDIDADYAELDPPRAEKVKRSKRRPG